jgi:hypothetical protein
MSTNTYKIKPEEISKKERSSSLFDMIGKKINVGNLFEDGFPVKYLPKIGFITLVLIFYIANAHFAERKVRQIEKMKIEVEDIRADYTTLKADLMFASKQSEVAKKVSVLGLEETHEPPIQIEIED